MQNPATQLLRIRHAHVDTGAGAGPMCGWFDLPLSAVGRQQVHEVRDRVVAREQPDALYTSTLIRARETSAALARIRNLPLQLRGAVREIHWR